MKIKSSLVPISLILTPQVKDTYLNRITFRANLFLTKRDFVIHLALKYLRMLFKL